MPKRPSATSQKPSNDSRTCLKSLALSRWLYSSLRRYRNAIRGALHITSSDELRCVHPHRYSNNSLDRTVID
ncbi:MAG: hypothetical protein IJ165_02340 [Proteobacteria bacterium]|nr:hypothetical protein [Pseudomonadota bacterium]